jgi:hypothetical protein
MSTCEIRFANDYYAVLRDGVLIGTVERCVTGSEVDWGWFPLRQCGTWPVQLKFALSLAIRDARGKDAPPPMPCSMNAHHRSPLQYH